MANTNKQLSETAVANFAANTLDERRLASLDDTTTTFARYVGDEFGYLRDEFLQMYPWAFARELASLPELEDAPAFRYQYAYQLPADCLRIEPITYNGAHNGKSFKFERFGTKIYTDCSGPLNVIYTKKLVDLQAWDSLAARALGQYIALQAAHRVTGKLSYMDKAERAFNRAMWSANHVDSLTRGTPEKIEESEVLSQRSLTSEW